MQYLPVSTLELFIWSWLLPWNQIASLTFLWDSWIEGGHLNVFTLTTEPISLWPKDRLEEPVTTGTRKRSRTSCYRKDASRYSNYLRLHMPVVFERGWYVAPKWPRRPSWKKAWWRKRCSQQFSLRCSWYWTPGPSVQFWSQWIQTFDPQPPATEESCPHFATWFFCEGRHFGKKEVETDRFLADNFWKRWLKDYIPALQERQKWQKTKCRDWRPCTTCRGVVGKGAVAHGSNRLNSSQQRWACGNGWTEDWSANIISATHSETLFIRRVGKPLPRLRHSV